MRRLALLFLVMLVAGDAAARDRRCRPTRSGARLQDSCGGFVALCDALTAGDKSGAWECMKGDGTMASGSATTFVATGTPTNTTENGWPVRTYTSAQNDQQPSNAAFPQSDFTVCTHHRSVALPNVQLAGFGDGSNAGTATLPFEQQTNGGLIAYAGDGVGISPGVTSAAGVNTAGAWYLDCYTYQRVGGAGNNVGTLYVNGISVATISTQRLIQALSSKWSTNGATGAVAASASSVRGFLVTYKALSAADIARIYARLGP